MTHLEIKMLLELAREYGVAKLKLQDLEVEFKSHSSFQSTTNTEDLVPKTQELSDEDLLFYSVNGQSTTPSK